MSGWKTVAYGVAIAIISIFSDEALQAFVAANLPAVGTAMGALVVVLRALTNSPIFKAKEKA